MRRIWGGSLRKPFLHKGEVLGHDILKKDMGRLTLYI